MAEYERFTFEETCAGGSMLRDNHTGRCMFILNEHMEVVKWVLKELFPSE